MKVIWKYPLQLPLTRLMLPESFKILHISMQHDEAYLWGQSDVDDPKVVERQFVTVGTGNMVSDDSVYIGTIHQDPYVWHLMEIKLQPL